MNVLLPAQVDSLIEAFGTSKQKKALNSRRLNQVGSDTLQVTVSKAANAVIEQKGLEGELAPPQCAVSDQISPPSHLHPSMFLLPLLSPQLCSKRCLRPRKNYCSTCLLAMQKQTDQRTSMSLTVVSFFCVVV